MRGSLRVAHDAEFGRQHDVVAAVGDGLADQDLVGPEAVLVGGVEHRDAKIDRVMDGGDRLGVIGGAVELRHPHASQSLLAAGQALRSQCPLLHDLTLLRVDLTPTRAGPLDLQ